ncbi:MAG: SAM-dependent chlorinase/fluorinase [Candidatus Rokubacteria bacterium]|nr:SAM-dependent chlorinase/fluorinase [Candidatus Rokubacteria bacterium]
MAIITLTTDFGTRDPYVGAMKGVILQISPGIRLVDLTHEISPHEILEGALALEAAAPFFPPGTIHLAVVDPGVGSPRRPLAIAAGGQQFVGPDNGLFSFLFCAGDWSAVRLEAPAYRLPAVSQTFHGRDIFAPAAAHLALGTPLEQFGPPVTDPVVISWPAARREGDQLVGEVIYTDRFGNLVTSVRVSDLETLGPASSLTVEVEEKEAGKLVGCYADLPPVGAGAVIGSSGRLEISVREGSAVAVLGARRGSPVRVRKQ